MKRTALLMSLCLALVAFSGTGCIVDPHLLGGRAYLSDLVVDWQIAGLRSRRYCGDYEIDYWLVELEGPGFRRFRRDCRQDYWSSETEFFALSLGDYWVSLEARDDRGHRVAYARTRVDLDPFGGPDSLLFELEDSDFYR